MSVIEDENGVQMLYVHWFVRGFKNKIEGGKMKAYGFLKIVLL